jgi:hypothetical protein
VEILLGAQSCGFGPVSKLAATSRLLAGHRRVFIGDTVAVRFVRNNPDAFDEAYDLDVIGESGLDRLILRADCVISVMNAELLFRARAAGRPALFIDSLLGFWQMRRDLADIAKLAYAVADAPIQVMERRLADLTPHERVLAAHVLASASVVQNFAGAPERVAQLDEVRTTPVRVTGAIISPAAEPPDGVPRDQYDLVINLGGFKNFLLDFNHHNEYLLLMDRWVRDLLTDWPQFERVVVCGGAFERPYEVTCGKRSAQFRLVPQREFLQIVADTPHYLGTPGLTALHEAVRLGRFPMGLPEQHYGHVINLRSLAGLAFGRMAASFTDVDPDYHIPDDDLLGTAAIVEFVRSVLASAERYDLLRTRLNERIERCLGMSSKEREDGVRELRTALDGPPFPQVLADLFAEPAVLSTGDPQ